MHNAYGISPVAGLERMTTGSDALSYRTRQVDTIHKYSTEIKILPIGKSSKKYQFNNVSVIVVYKVIYSILDNVTNFITTSKTKVGRSRSQITQCNQCESSKSSRAKICPQSFKVCSLFTVRCH